MKRLMALLGIVVVAATGCATDNFKDLKGVPNQKPDYARHVENMDGHPNIGMLCVNGVGFATTTRDYNAIMRVPEWDSFCSQYGSR